MLEKASDENLVQLLKTNDISKKTKITINHILSKRKLDNVPFESLGTKKNKKKKKK